VHFAVGWTQLPDAAEKSLEPLVTSYPAQFSLTASVAAEAAVLQPHGHARGHGGRSEDEFSVHDTEPSEAT